MIKDEAIYKQLVDTMPTAAAIIRIAGNAAETDMAVVEFSNLAWKEFFDLTVEEPAVGLTEIMGGSCAEKLAKAVNSDTVVVFTDCISRIQRQVHFVVYRLREELCVCMASDDGIEPACRHRRNFAVAVNSTVDFIFDYDVAERMLFIQHNSANEAEVVAEIADIPIEQVLRKYVYRAHMFMLFKYVRYIVKSNDGRIECKLKFRYKNEESYKWYLVRLRAIRDALTGRVSTVVGTMVNIHEEWIKRLQLEVTGTQDALTGLYNRMMTERRIDTILRHRPAKNALYALYIMDIDKFKQINDTYGHAAGDVVLKTIGGGLSISFGEQDVIGRLGGDEFVIFSHCQGSYNWSVAQKAAYICDFVSSLNISELNGERVSVSVGAAICPADGVTFDELYLAADKALYQAKNRGRNTYHVYGTEKPPETELLLDDI